MCDYGINYKLIDDPKELESINLSNETYFDTVLLAEDMKSYDLGYIVNSLHDNESTQNSQIICMSYFNTHDDFFFPSVNLPLITRPIIKDELLNLVFYGQLPEQINPASEASIKIVQVRDFEEKFNLLLAEDSPANVVVATAVLEKAGHQVDVAGNGIEAVEMVKLSIEHENYYDLILMDLMMPEVDGLEATHIIRKLNHPVSQIPIIAMTAKAMKGDKEECLKSGMDAYIAKPFNTENLLKIIHDTVQENQAKNFVKEESHSSTSLSDNKGGNTQKSGSIHFASDWPLLEDEILKQMARDTSEELVPQMISVFIQELTKRLNNIEFSIDNKKCADIAEEVHALKSSGGTYGALALQHEAKKIDALCKSDDCEKVLEQSLSLPPLLRDTIIIFEKYITNS